MLWRTSLELIFQAPKTSPQRSPRPWRPRHPHGGLGEGNGRPRDVLQRGPQRQNVVRTCRHCLARCQSYKSFYLCLDWLNSFAQGTFVIRARAWPQMEAPKVDLLMSYLMLN